MLPNIETRTIPHSDYPLIICKCGSVPKLEQFDDQFLASCVGCGADGGFQSSAKAAQDAWNA